LLIDEAFNEFDDTLAMLGPPSKIASAAGDRRAGMQLSRDTADSDTIGSKSSTPIRQVAPAYRTKRCESLCELLAKYAIQVMKNRIKEVDMTPI